MLVAGCRQPVQLGPVVQAKEADRIREALAPAPAATDAGEAEQAAQVGTGWATLEGRFVFNEPPPARLPLAVTKDPTVCAPAGRAVLSEALLVDSATHGIANVAVYLRDAPRVHESAQPTEDEVIFDQKQCIFLSHVFGMKIGQTVLIKNSDPVGHNTKIDGNRGDSFNQTIPVNESLAFKPTKEEPTAVPVSCSIHPWMQAYFLPRNNGYFAISGKDGSFELENLPAGEELEFQVWHESAKGPGNALILNSPQAKELNWNNRGRFKVTLEPDQTMDLGEMEVPADSFR
jgi:hypothetical protein